MKSYLIKDTTKEERIALIREWIPVDENLDGNDIDLWDMRRKLLSAMLLSMRAFMRRAICGETRFL